VGSTVGLSDGSLVTGFFDGLSEGELEGGWLGLNVGLRLK
jgi:hypothetical protein